MRDETEKEGGKEEKIKGGAGEMGKPSDVSESAGAKGKRGEVGMSDSG